MKQILTEAGKEQDFHDKVMIALNNKLSFLSFLNSSKICKALNNIIKPYLSQLKAGDIVTIYTRRIIANRKCLFLITSA